MQLPLSGAAQRIWPPNRGHAAWLDEVCGSRGLAMAPAGFASVVNDAEPLYFEDATFAYAFIARFCRGYWVKTIGAAPRLRRPGAYETA
jgi:hypothetical protein